MSSTVLPRLQISVARPAWSILMKRLTQLSGFVVLLILSDRSLEASPQYKGFVLYPTDAGAIVSGISDGRVVGGTLGGHASVWNPPLGEMTDLHPAALPDS